MVCGRGVGWVLDLSITAAPISAAYTRFLTVYSTVYLGEVVLFIGDR